MGHGGSFPAEADCAGEERLSFPERAAARRVCSVSQHPALRSRARAFPLSRAGEDISASLPAAARPRGVPWPQACSTSRPSRAWDQRPPSGGPCIAPGTPKPPALGPISGVLGPTTLGARGGRGAGGGWGSPAAPRGGTRLLVAPRLELQRGPSGCERRQPLLPPRLSSEIITTKSQGKKKKKKKTYGKRSWFLIGMCKYQFK